jgi:hypothetical protein
MELGDKYDVPKEAQDIVDGRQQDDEEIAHQEALRVLVVKLNGPHWQHCTIERHTARGGKVIYTAAIICAIHKVHVVVMEVED